jgi:hypothetical protein
MVTSMIRVTLLDYYSKFSRTCEFNPHQKAGDQGPVAGGAGVGG